MIGAGKLRHVVTLQRKNVTAKDAVGAEVYTWETMDTERADVRPLTGREPFIGDQLRDESTVEFGMRYRDDIAPEWRILWQGRPYDVRAVIDVRGRGRELLVLAGTGLKDG